MKVSCFFHQNKKLYFCEEMESVCPASAVLFCIVYLQLLKFSVAWRLFFSRVLSLIWFESFIPLKQTNFPVAKSTGILAFLLRVCS